MMKIDLNKRWYYPSLLSRKRHCFDDSNISLRKNWEIRNDDYETSANSLHHCAKCERKLKKIKGKNE